jgi:riboflavin kinase, archaea type
MQLKVRGKVFSGMGKGRYYVGHPEYQKRFAQFLGYAPYPGTLNVKLEDPRMTQALGELRSAGGIKVPSFTLDGESFSSLTCFGGELRGERVTLLFIDVTYYNETVAELISQTYLRGRFRLRDGEEIEFTVDVPDSSPDGR